MNNKTLFSYDNWWLGKVALCFCTIISNGSDIITLVEWGDFSENDTKRIRDKQKKIFHKSVENLTSKLKEEFLNRYELSQLKNEFLSDEIKQCDDIMFSKLPTSEFITFSHWDCAFERNDLLEMQKYIRKTLKNGIEDDYSDVHSPNFKYQDKNKIPSKVYAQFVWNYSIWLNSQFLKKRNVSLNKARLKVKQIALIYAYKGSQITRENADNIAAEYGYTSKTSGEGLFQDYTLFCDPRNRINRTFPFTYKKMENKIKLLESVLPYLTDNVVHRAKDEIKTLRTKVNDEFS